MKVTLEQLVTELESIARKNEDTFRYHITINPRRNGPFVYSFIAEEDADGLTFVSGDGESIEAACEDAHDDIKGALDNWGYEAP